MSAVDPKPKRVWTVLLYMAGDNNLSEECVYALTEAKEALTDKFDELAVLAQFDPSGVRAETRRYLLRSPNFTLQEDAELTGWTARETDTGEPHNLLEFIRWGISQYPAEYFMVVLVGHGSGTDDDFLVRDENPPGALSILELRDVFTQLTNDGHTIDILGMDTCLMNMAEVCFELNRTNTTFLVGSEGFSPNTGWPYKDIFDPLVKQIEADSKTSDETKKVARPEWLARLIVEEYMRFYVPYINGGISVDQSVLDIVGINDVKRKMFSLVGSLLDEFEKGELNYGKPKQNALLLAHWESQSYNGEVFVDLFDFCDRLALRYPRHPGSEVIRFCREVQNAIAGLVIRSCVAGAAFQFSYGISIYFPWAELSPRYGNLSFPKETRWLDFLDQYHKKTRREGRRELEFRETIPPGRASVPINKGRDGRVESMRNPPTEEVKGCSDVDVKTNWDDPPPPDPPPTAAQARTKTRTTKPNGGNTRKSRR